MLRAYLLKNTSVKRKVIVFYDAWNGKITSFFFARKYNNKENYFEYVRNNKEL